MHWFLVILMVAAFWHYIAQRVLVPESRFRVRCELFAVRDKTRRLMIKGSSTKEMRELSILHDRCNTLINRVHHLSADSLYRFHRELEQNEELKTRVEKRANELKSFSPELLEVHFELSKLIFKAVRANSLGLLPYLAPFFLVGKMLLNAKELAKEIGYVRDSEFNRFVPEKHATDLSFAA